MRIHFSLPFKSSTASRYRYRVHLCRSLMTTQSDKMPYTPMTEAEQARYRDLQNLLAKFHDPQSPYYIPPGSKGPIDENDHSTSKPPIDPKEVATYGSGKQYDQSRADARKWFSSQGFDPRGTLEWPVAWGDCDMFQHVNNTHYVKWFEAARIQYIENIDLPNDDAKKLLSGKGTGVILKELSVKYKAPVTYSDTVYMACKPHSVDQENARFGIATAFYSLKDNKVVATADCTIVMYNYDEQRKGSMSDTLRDALLRRTQL